ncbi:MAG: sel1 repeat family protein [Holosporales bacterium]|jgi:TPR repeat protein|nr:sel1 repeat family protein [Holosporales bacterium]
MLKNYFILPLMLGLLPFCDSNASCCLEDPTKPPPEVLRKVARLEEDASKGICDAQFKLFEHYKGCHREREKALRYLVDAADGGHLKAQVEYAKMLEIGENVEQDYRAAVHYFGLAAGQGDRLAKYKGALIALNHGTPEERRIAANTFPELTSEFDSAVDIWGTILGKLDNHGVDGIPQDIDEAYRLLISSRTGGYDEEDPNCIKIIFLHDTLPDIEARAQGGDSLAQFRLYEIYTEGRDGLPADSAKAWGYLLQAAEGGLPQALRERELNPPVDLPSLEERARNGDHSAQF